MMQQTYTGGRVNGPTSQRSIGDLFGDLADETRTLVQQEVRLAGAEMNEKAAKAGRNTGYIFAGGLVAYAGLLALLAGISIGLVELLSPGVMPIEVALWLAPVIVGVVVGFIGYMMLQHGIHAISHLNLTPRRTVRSLRETQRWMQDQVR